MSADVSAMGLGTASIGNLYREVGEERAFAALEAAWDGGIRYFDTAPHYGLGLAERRLGAFLRDRPRDEYVVSTKVGRLLEPNPLFSGGRDLAHGFDVPDSLVRRFDPTLPGIRRSLEESLTRLGLDRIDILFLHDPDAYDLEWGLRDGLPALATLRDEGLVDAIGVGVNDSAVATRAVTEGDLDVVMIAGRYTLLDQSAADDLLPICAERDVRIVDAAVFNSGLLATSVPRASAHYDYGSPSGDVLARARLLAEVCAEFDVELPTAALHYPLRDPLVSMIVVGASDPASIAQNLDRLSQHVPDGLWVALAERGLLHDALTAPGGRR